MTSFEYHVHSLSDCLGKSQRLVLCSSVSDFIQKTSQSSYNSFDALSDEDKYVFMSNFFFLSKNLLNFFLSSDVKLIFSREMKPETFYRSVSALRHFIEGIDKIRAVYKGYKQRKLYHELVRGFRKKNNDNEKSSSFVVKEIKAMVSYRKLTLEQCFRAADKDGDGQVSHQEMQNFLEQLKLSIPKSYITKFIRILDEDCSGIITKEEYYKTLSAYSVQTESQNQSGRTIQQEALIKFTEVLKKKEIEPQEMFNLCDIDMSGCITLKELERYIKILGINFQEKETAALMNLFDSNSNGEITTDEFLKYMDQGTKALFKLEENKATHGANQAEAFNVSRLLEIGRNTLFDILDEVNYFLSQEKFLDICKRMNPRLTASDLASLVKTLYNANSSQVTKAQVEEFCLYHTEIHMLNKEQYRMKINVVLKRNKINFRIIAEKEQAIGLVEQERFSSILKKYLGFTPSQVRKFYSLFNVPMQVNCAEMDNLIQPLGPIGFLYNALEEQKLDISKFFDIADKKKTGKISSTDFEVTAVVELKNLESKILTELALMFPLPRIDKPTFLKVFRQETRIDKFEVALEPVIPQPSPTKPEIKIEPEVPRSPHKRSTLFVHGNERGGEILRKFVEQCPPNVLTHEYLEKIGLYLRQLVDRDKFFSFAQLFKVSRIESDELFRMFDRKNTGFVYSFTFLLTLESIRNPHDKIPTQDNIYAEPASKSILETLVRSLDPNLPIYKHFSNLAQIVDWDSVFPSLLPESSIDTLSRAFPSPCYYYQLAAVLEAYSQQQFLCGELVLLSLIDRNKINKQASEYFEDIQCEAVFTRNNLINKLVRYMSRIEAESIYQFVYKNEENKPAYHFFTFFDYALTWHRNKIQKPIAMPVKGSEKVEGMADVFVKIAILLDKPLQTYGFSLQDDNSDIGFAQVFERALKVPRNESIQCFRLLKPTNDHRIKLYHIIYVLDSFRTNAVNVSSIKSYFNTMIHEYLPYGATFVISCGLFLSQQVPVTSLTTTFAFMPETDRNSFLSKIGSPGRNFVYGFEIANEIDKLQYQFAVQNNKCLDCLKTVGLRVNAKVFEIEENMFKMMVEVEHFVSLVQGFMDKDQAFAVWTCLKIESFSKVAMYTLYAELAKNVDFNVYNKPDDIRVLGLCVPDSVSSPDFFPNIELSKVYLNEEAAEILSQRSKIDTTIALSIAIKCDSRFLGKIFGFELLSTIDLIRSSCKSGKIVSEIFNLPTSSNKKSAQSLQQFLKMVASELDFNNEPTFDHYSNLKEFNIITQKTLLASFPNLPESNLRELFVSMNFMPSGILYYHLMAVIESYRTKFIQVKPAEASVKTSARDPKASIKQAKLKLKAYILGDNPKKRKLDSAEIFGMMDKNKDGTISADEFMACLDMLRLNLTANEKIALTKEVDKNMDERINYDEIMYYLEDGDENVDIKGLEHSLSSFKAETLDYAIFLLKMYVHNNKTGPNSLEAVFLRLDEDKSGGLNETEFKVALGRLNLSLTNEHIRMLRDWSPKNENSETLYRSFFEKVCKHEFLPPSKQVPKISGMKEPIIEAEVQPIKKLNPDTDYFTPTSNKKWTTILNNEDAALARCFELYSNAPRFKDPDFGPEIGQNGSTCLYWTGKPPCSNYPPANEIKWKSPGEWLQNVGFFKGGISSNDVIQGSLGDCWFIGALSVLAQRDELVRGSIENLNSEDQVNENNVIGIRKGVYPPLFHHFANKGLYVFRFFANSSWRWVIIDDRLPIAEQEGYEPSYVFGHCKDPAEIWVSLIEKAYSKLYGCYEALNGGLIDDALVDLTGYVAEKTKIKVTTPQEAEELWRLLSQYKSNKCLMGCSIDSEGVESDVVIDGEPCGLLARHAYAIIDVIQIDDPTCPKRRHRLIRLRNPWGQREWNGKWSDNSEEVNKNLEKLQNELKKLGSDEDYNPHDGNDGTFLMCFRDWRNIFHNLYSCVDFSDEWWGVRFFSEWTSFNSGGVPMSNNRQDAINWAKNPQFVMDLKNDCQVFISLCQDDGRFTKGSVFPFEGPIKTACFTLLRLAATENDVKFFDQSKIVKLSVLKLHRTIEMRENLKAGKYLIVPATIKAGLTGKFSLSVYLNCPKTSADLYTAADKVKGIVIEEEEEIGMDSVTPRLLQNIKGLVRDITRRK